MTIHCYEIFQNVGVKWFNGGGMEFPIVTVTPNNL